MEDKAPSASWSFILLQEEKCSLSGRKGLKIAVRAQRVLGTLLLASSKVLSKWTRSRRHGLFNSTLHFIAFTLQKVISERKGKLKRATFFSELIRICIGESRAEDRALTVWLGRTSDCSSSSVTPSDGESTFWASHLCLLLKWWLSLEIVPFVVNLNWKFINLNYYLKSRK